MKRYRHTVNVLLFVFLLLCLILLFIEAWWFNDVGLQIRHCIGIVFLAGVAAVLFTNQNLFTLLLGVTLLIGNFAGLSVFSTITTWFIGFHIGVLPIPFYWGQPGFSVLLIIYLIFNKDFYTGIATKAYWKDFTSRTQDPEPVITVITPNKD